MSSEPAVKGKFEFAYNKPNKSDPEATRKKLNDAVAIQRQHPAFVDYAFQGVGVEDDTLTLSVLEWTSYEDHKSWSTWEKFPDFRKALDGAFLARPTIVHYAFSGTFPFTPTPPIIEHLVLRLKPDASYEAFLADFVKALRYPSLLEGFKGFAVGRQTEDPTIVLQLMGWEKLEQHTEGFPNSEGFPLFKEEMGKVLETYVDGAWEGIEMSHFKTVAEPSMLV